MSNLERARTYAAIFIGAGDGWRQYVPVDATVNGTSDIVYLGGIRMVRVGTGWLLESDGRTFLVEPKAAVSA